MLGSEIYSLAQTIKVLPPPPADVTVARAQVSGSA